MERIQILPDAVRTLNGLSHQGYTPEVAIADLVDNAISAHAEFIRIRFSEQPDGSSTVIVGDDGVGMDENTLRRAMQIGSAAELGRTSLSVYGMGMKTASLSFSSRFRVVSVGPSGKPVAAVLDMADQSENPWTVEIGDATERDLRLVESYTDNGTGTVIVWEEADFKDILAPARPSGRQKKITTIIDRVDEYLAMAFYRFLLGRVEGYPPLKMFINDKEILGWDPFAEDYLSNEWTVAEDRFELDIEEDGRTLKVPYVMKTYRILSQDDFESLPNGRELKEKSRMGMKWQGIFPIREDRVLQRPDWLNTISFHPDWNVLRASLELDPALDKVTKTDMKKSGLVLPPQMWESIYERLGLYSRTLRQQKRAEKRDRLANQAPEKIHDASNNQISSALTSLETPKITALGSGDYKVETMFGESITQLSELDIGLTSRDTRIQPVDSLPGDVLFEPRLNGGDQVILINKSHPFYQKVYIQLYQTPLAIQGLDFLLYSLAHAEWLTRTDRIKEQFARMRREMSETLRQFVLDIEDVESQEQDDDSGGSSSD